MVVSRVACVDTRAVPYARTTPEALLARARAGDEVALGRLLELYRNYLRLMARTLIGRRLRQQADPSDLVQETFLKAHREFPSFAGASEPELAAWLRQVLLRTLADLGRHHRAQRRDYQRQESLEALLDRSSVAMHDALAVVSSASARAARREEAVLLADALARLPADYREVFVLRSLEQLPFDDVAARMDRSSGAVRKLWTRAVLALKRELENIHE